MTTKEYRTLPIFQLGKVPKIPHCDIQERQYRDGKWHYFICNNYNAYASGWADEDQLIEQIKKHGTP